jgi:predicted nuclease with TOPRIM domain
VVSQWLLEKDEVIKKLSGESKKLRHKLNKAQVSSIDLEQRISELADSLKSVNMKKDSLNLPFMIRRKILRD